jgi:hypothetical protein
MKEIKYTILYCVFVRTFVIPFYYSPGIVINYDSGSNFLTSYGSGSGSTRQKVTGTVPTVLVPVPVPQHFCEVIKSHKTVEHKIKVFLTFSA